MTIGPITILDVIQCSNSTGRRKDEAEFAGVENAGIDQSVPDCKAGKCETNMYNHLLSQKLY